MAEILDLSDPEFTAQMEGLVEQAKQEIEDRTTVVARSEADKVAIKEAEERALKAYQSLPQMLKPFVQGIEALTRVAGENSQVLNKIDAITSDSLEPLKQLPAVVADLQGMIERKDALSRQMFDALHEELKSYKDGFLLDSVHRPIIRDLITLYDDLSDSHRQMASSVQEILPIAPACTVERMQTLETRLSHNLDFLLEVLARFEVTEIPAGTGKLDKRTQRAVAVESAETPEADLDIVRSIHRGFLWKDRVVRPEEVVIKKWKDGFLVALKSDT